MSDTAPGPLPPSPPTEGADPFALGADFPQAVGVRRERLSIVWLIPLLALAVGAWLVYKTVAEEGPVVHIQFGTAAGLQAGKTKVKFKDVDLGEVTAIDVSPDLKSVVVKAQLRHGSAPYLTRNTRFWVERPRVTASRVSGLDTLLSGPYIAIDPVTGGEPERRFVGLEEPPLFTTAEPGKRFILRASTLGSINIGSPVYYRQIQVGRVVGHELVPDGRAVDVEVFIAAPHDRLVYSMTRFWNASGFDISITATGVKFGTSSLLSLLIGGLSFDTPETIDGAREPAPAGQVFPLYQNLTEANDRSYAYKEHYLLYFSGSVLGLSTGSPVLLRGITLGRVLDVGLTFNAVSDDFQIPVLVEIEPERIGMGGQRSAAGSMQAVERLVGRGLRGQLKSASLLTGQLYVDLDFHPDAPPAQVTRQGDYLVLPTVPAPLQALTTRANSILQKIDHMPLEQIGKDLGGAVAGANDLINSRELRAAVTEAEAALTEFRQAVGRVNTQIAPELSTALQDTSVTMRHASDLIVEHSPLYIQGLRMFEELSAAARSLRVMADYLERHPEALLKGKAGGR